VPRVVRRARDLLAAEVAAHPFDPVAAAKNYWNSGLRNSIASDLPADRLRQALPAKMKSPDPLRRCAGNAVIALNGWETTGMRGRKQN